ncbi:protein of unknown function [Thermococcus nautili]|nr:protein of unknown function [Thermococcus nautili]
MQHYAPALYFTNDFQLSILLESYCNLPRRPREEYPERVFQFSSSLIATVIRSL